ncbi:hypothetical protein GCM10010869_25560 [Mesorhizobium tianshanense]|nr:hypothetical protein GCM10010869_25560 [Mesorhizobium tianshanense]
MPAQAVSGGAQALSIAAASGETAFGTIGFDQREELGWIPSRNDCMKLQSSSMLYAHCWTIRARFLTIGRAG